LDLGAVTAVVVAAPRAVGTVDCGFGFGFGFGFDCGFGRGDRGGEALRHDEHGCQVPVIDPTAGVVLVQPGDDVDVKPAKVVFQHRDERVGHLATVVVDHAVVDAESLVAVEEVAGHRV